MPEFKKWKSINKFSDAYAKAQKFGVGKVKYATKIKLHGTNAGIHFEDGVATAMKRSSFIDEWHDNCGFAKWVSNLNIKYSPESEFTIYGEWAGPGVQKSDAVTQIPQKSFFVFAIMSGNDYFFEPADVHYQCELFFGQDYERQGVYVLPWYKEDLVVDFQRQNQSQKFVDWIMNDVDKIGKMDPYIHKIFGVEGPGEGVVAYPIKGWYVDGKDVSDEYLMDFMFKAKTEVHSVNKDKNRNHVAPERPEGVDDFIDMFYTEARFEQMLNELGGKATPEKTGQFLKAVHSDVYKESEQERLISDVDWKVVPKFASVKVKQWWFKKCNEL